MVEAAPGTVEVNVWNIGVRLLLIYFFPSPFLARCSGVKDM